MTYSFDPGGVSSKSSVTVGPVYNIIVLVAGTADPTNMTKARRANSYPSRTTDPEDASYYWKEDNAFLDTIHKLAEDLARYNVAVFNVHGWTGDNWIADRQRAGEYLTDRLCGSNGEEAYYEGYKKKNVQFHLIGHSHGGNVIHEMTARMAVCPEWPKTWSVKTIVYLSVPFFPTLHRINTARLHEGCMLVNVYNYFDLTQRVIASFSLHQIPLGDALDGKTAELQGWLRELVHTDFETLLTVSLAFLGSEIGTVDSDDLELDDIRGWLKDYLTGRHFDRMKRVARRVADKASHIDPTLGRKFYNECRRRLQSLHEVIYCAMEIIDSLTKLQSYDVTDGLKGKIHDEHKVMSAELGGRFKVKLNAIDAGLRKTTSAFKARLQKDEYTYSGFIDDIHLNELLRPLVDFLRINPPEEDGQLKSEPVPKDSLFDLIAALLLEQIESFEAVRTNPTFQLENTPFRSRVCHIPVMRSDPYADAAPAIHLNGGAFIEELVGLARRYGEEQTSTNLLDILFTLVAQIEVVHSMMSDADGISVLLATLDWVNVGDDGFEKIIEDLRDIFRYYRTVLEARTHGKGGIVVTEDPEDAKKGIYKRGSLEYLMITSHSISRRPLDTKVVAILRDQIMKEKGYDWPPPRPKGWSLIGPGLQEH